jgi:hypothetical protein
VRKSGTVIRTAHVVRSSTSQSRMPTPYIWCDTWMFEEFRGWELTAGIRRNWIPWNGLQVCLNHFVFPCAQRSFLDELLVDTGSANIWVGANKPYVVTSTRSVICIYPAARMSTHSISVDPQERLLYELHYTIIILLRRCKFRRLVAVSSYHCTHEVLNEHNGHSIWELQRQSNMIDRLSH